MSNSGARIQNALFIKNRTQMCIVWNLSRAYWHALEVYRVNKSSKPISKAELYDGCIWIRILVYQHYGHGYIIVSIRLLKRIKPLLVFLTCEASRNYIVDHAVIKVKEKCIHEMISSAAVLSSWTFKKIDSPPFFFLLLICCITTLNPNKNCEYN